MQLEGHLNACSPRRSPPGSRFSWGSEVKLGRNVRAFPVIVD
jgi:hypothetical protein